MKIRKSRGFTLIELLVVIAIIGILAAIVLVSLGGARNKARDARIQGEMSQIRVAAEMSFSDSNNYDAVACSGGNADIAKLCTDIDLQNGTGAGVTISKPATPAGSYCASVPMNTGSYCIDSNGVAKSYTAATTACTATYTCP